ncbi:MAG: hypothetical protein E2P02_08405 [Acidobacteria bacterium]|nr:MAG: hypothetical protein E2P02_08405 [Acidobacteriota bacterium]
MTTSTPRWASHPVSVCGESRLRLNTATAKSWGRRWLREIQPGINVHDFTDQQGELVSRYTNWTLFFFFQNGGLFGTGSNGSLENLSDPFNIHPTTTIMAGSHDFREHFVRFATDSSRTLSFSGRAASGSFYSGNSFNVNINGALKLGPRLTTEVSWNYNDIDLEEGDFTTNQFASRVKYSFSTTMFLDALVQYNSVVQEWNSNIRFNVIHRPLSDFFLVYNERRDESGRRIDRALIAKFTYLLDF